MYTQGQKVSARKLPKTHVAVTEGFALWLCRRDISIPTSEREVYNFLCKPCHF